MNNEIVIRDGAEKLVPTLGEAFVRAAFAQAEELVSVGQTAREAGSIIANLMVEAAWAVAASCTRAEGIEPDKDKFRAVVEAVLARVRFDFDEQVEEAPHDDR